MRPMFPIETASSNKHTQKATRQKWSANDFWFIPLMMNYLSYVVVGGICLFTVQFLCPQIISKKLIKKNATYFSLIKYIHFSMIYFCLYFVTKY